MATVVDFGLLRGVLTALLFAAFIGLLFWAWSSRRADDFAQAAQLPLDDVGPVPAPTETGHDK